MLIGYTVQPIMFVLLFVYVFGGSIDTGMDYVDFLIPGIIVQNITFGGALTAVGLVEDLNKGLIDRFRSLPMARSAVLAGRTLADVVVNLFGVIIILLVGLVVGFRFDSSVPEVALRDRPAAAVRLRLQLDLRARAACTRRAPRARSRSGSPSSSRSPSSRQRSCRWRTCPHALEAFAKVNPFTITVDAMRHLFVGTPAGNSVWLATVWSIGLMVVFAPLAVLKYRKVSAR